jgi:hypothetical protein
MQMEHEFERHRGWIPWALTSLLLIVVALVAYSAGARHEAVQAGTEGTRVMYRHGPWGFGFLWFFVIFWLFGGLRWLFWRPWYGPRWRNRRPYHGDYDDPRGDWEAWHRREHERMQDRGARDRDEDSKGDRGRPPASSSSGDGE